MKQFLKFTLATAVGLMLGVLSIIIIVSIATSGGSKEVQLDEPHVLSLELNGAIQDRVEEIPFDLSEITGQDVNILGLNDILANIKKAKTDENIKGIYIEMGMPSADEGESPKNEGETPIAGDEESDDSGEGNGDADGEDKSNEDTTTSAVSQEAGDDDGHETWTEDTQREREGDLLEKSPERQYERSGQPQYSSGLSSENMDKILYSYADAKDLRNSWLAENADDEYAVATKKRGRKRTVLTSAAGDTSKATLSKKTLLG